MRTTILACCIPLLASGCSFLQDWGALRSGSDGGGGGMDGGARDGGDVDGGADAGEPCNVCEAQGCDPVDATVCVQDGTGCFVCDTPGLGEGERCAIEEECEERLTCEQGLCLTPCGSHEECLGSAIGDFCGIGDRSASAVCVARDCTPVVTPGGGCSDGRVCTIFYDASDDTAPPVGTMCLPPTAETLGMNLPCDRLGAAWCTDGLGCTPDDTGDHRCHVYCHLDDAAATCSPEEECRPLPGRTATLDDRQLGTCLLTDPPPPPRAQCATTMDCVDAGLGDECTAGRCLRSCSTDTDCPSGRRCFTTAGVGTCVESCSDTSAPCPNGLPCVDANADGTFECHPRCDAAGLACPSGFDCLFDVCVFRCNSGGDCPMHAPICTDVDLDGNRRECTPAPPCVDSATCPSEIGTCSDLDDDGVPECVPG